MQHDSNTCTRKQPTRGDRISTNPTTKLQSTPAHTSFTTHITPQHNSPLSQPWWWKPEAQEPDQGGEGQASQNLIKKEKGRQARNWPRRRRAGNQKLNQEEKGRQPRAATTSPTRSSSKSSTTPHQPSSTNRLISLQIIPANLASIWSACMGGLGIDFPQT
jgi:hypothetical protein